MRNPAINYYLINKKTQLTFRFCFLRSGLVVIRVGPIATTVFLLFVFPNVFRRNSFHTVDFDLDIGPIGQRVWNFIDRFLMYLHAVNGKARSGVQFLMANVTFKVFCLLMLHQNLFVIELSVAVPTGKGRVELREGGMLEKTNVPFFSLRNINIYVIEMENWENNIFKHKSIPAPGLRSLLLFTTHYMSVLLLLLFKTRRNPEGNKNLIS